MTVLEAPPPRFTAAEVAGIAAQVFGAGGPARDLGSERDQTFLVEGGVLKISNSGEDAAALDLEAAAIFHIARADPGLRVARPQPAPGRGDGLAAYRPAIDGPDGTHFVRLFEHLQGRSAPAHTLSDAALRHYGTTHARLTLALRAFFHPAAGRELLWDVQRAPHLRPLLSSIPDERRRALVRDVLDRFDAHVVPVWPSLRAQVVHGDVTLDNVLLDGDGHVCGIVDFGDMGHSAVAADL